MRNLTLHKYFTLNLFIYINCINFFNFCFFVFLNIVRFRWMLHFLENVFITWFIIALIGIPASGFLMFVEFILRKNNIIRKNCDEIFSQHQIKILYCLAIAFFIFYIIYILHCLQPPTPSEIEALRYD